MHLLLRTPLLLRLGDVMRVDACERHSEYSRVVHGLIAPRRLALSFRARPAPGCDASIMPACDSQFCSIATPGRKTLPFIWAGRMISEFHQSGLLTYQNLRWIRKA